jgi:hypothetical protein
VTSIQNQISKTPVTNLPSTPSTRSLSKKKDDPSRTPTKLPAVINDEVKAASSTLVATSQVKTPKKRAANKTITSPRTKKKR